MCDDRVVRWCIDSSDDRVDGLPFPPVHWVECRLDVVVCWSATTTMTRFSSVFSMKFGCYWVLPTRSPNPFHSHIQLPCWMMTTMIPAAFLLCWMVLYPYHLVHLRQNLNHCQRSFVSAVYIVWDIFHGNIQRDHRFHTQHQLVTTTIGVVVVRHQINLAIFGRFVFSRGDWYQS